MSTARPSQIIDIAKQLVDGPKPRIDESIFIKNYLPLFSANIAKGSEEKDFVPITAWLDVAASPFNEVEVVSGDQVLFVVPPLAVDAKGLFKESESKKSIADVVVEASKRSEIMPKLGEMHLRQYLLNRLQEKTITLDIAERWNIIFKRYGLPVIPLPVDEKPAVEASTTNTPEVQKAVSGDNDDLLEL